MFEGMFEGMAARVCDLEGYCVWFVKDELRAVNVEWKAATDYL